MSDITPKIKLYIFISIIHLIINIGVILYKMIISNGFSLSDIVFSASALGTSFIPFVDIISFLFLGLPGEVLGLIVLFTGLLSAVQSVLIAMMILQVIHNIIWNPDV